MEGPFVRTGERVWIGFRGEANRVCVVRRQRGEKVAGGDRTNREWEFRQEERVEERMGGVERPRSKREEWNSGVCFCAQRVVHWRERYI